MKKIVTIILFMLLPGFVFSQLRYVKGMNQGQSSFVVTPSGMGGSLGYNRMITGNIIVGGSLEYEKAGVGKTFYDEIRGDIVGKYMFFSKWEDFFANALLSISMNEMMRSTDVSSITNNKFIVGNAVGIEGDYFLTDNISLYLQFKQRFYYLNHSVEIFATNFGVRYNFY